MVEQRFPISNVGYTVGKLMDGTECQMQTFKHFSLNYL